MDIATLTTAEIAWLATVLTKAAANDYSVRVAFDNGVKIKVNEGMWTAPLGVDIQTRG